jgi:hypothetical protein
MKIKLHHLNLCSQDVPAMNDFYRAVLDLDSEPSLNELASLRMAIPPPSPS